MTATCPGCIGRGTGSTCYMCDKPIPTNLRRTNGDAYLGDHPKPGCPDCAAGRRHSHR